MKYKISVLLTLSILLVSPSILAETVQTIPAAQARGENKELAKIYLAPGQGVNLSFLQTRERVYQAWVDDSRLVDLSAEVPLEQGAQILHLSALRKKGHTRLTLITLDAQQQKGLYMFSIQMSKTSPRSLVTIVPGHPYRPPTPTHQRTAQPAVLNNGAPQSTFQSLQAGMQLAHQRGLLQQGTELWSALEQYASLLEAGWHSSPAAQQVGLQQAVIDRLINIGRTSPQHRPLPTPSLPPRPRLPVRVDPDLIVSEFPPPPPPSEAKFPTKVLPPPPAKSGIDLAAQEQELATQENQLRAEKRLQREAKRRKKREAKRNARAAKNARRNAKRQARLDRRREKLEREKSKAKYASSALHPEPFDISASKSTSARPLQQVDKSKAKCGSKLNSQLTKFYKQDAKYKRKIKKRQAKYGEQDKKTLAYLAANDSRNIANDLVQGLYVLNLQGNITCDTHPFIAVQSVIKKLRKGAALESSVQKFNVSHSLIEKLLFFGRSYQASSSKK